LRCRLKFEYGRRVRLLRQPDIEEPRDVTDRPTFDPRLYLILDPRQCAGRPPADIAAAAATGGATLVQYRAKDLGTRQMISHAREIRAALAPFAIPLLINDRVDVALAAGAEGVHLGQTDMEADDARRLLGPAAIIGLTARSLDEVEAAPVELIDYISIGGVFATRSKDNPDPPIGLDGLRRIAGRAAALSDLPRTAISGIDAENCRAVIEAGVGGIAVISAICAAPDPEEAAADLRRRVDAALEAAQ
jgi:thiamine-phosphate pyrophosphorylase